MKLKKGTDVYELALVESDIRYLIKAKGKEGAKLTAALEKLFGSPALDDYGVDSREYNKITISRYRLPADTKLDTEG